LKNHDKEIAALRIWLDVPNLMVSYERRGITIFVVSLRVEAAKAAVASLNDRLLLFVAAGAGDPERVETLREILDMTREALSGGPGQVWPLTRSGVSALDSLFGEVS
jgi:hypothetical protein